MLHCDGGRATDPTTQNYKLQSPEIFKTTISAIFEFEHFAIIEMDWSFLRSDFMTFILFTHISVFVLQLMSRRVDGK